MIGVASIVRKKLARIVTAIIDGDVDVPSLSKSAVASPYQRWGRMKVWA